MMLCPHHGRCHRRLMAPRTECLVSVIIITSMILNLLLSSHMMVAALCYPSFTYHPMRTSRLHVPSTKECAVSRQRDYNSLRHPQSSHRRHSQSGITLFAMPPNESEEEIDESSNHESDNNVTLSLPTPKVTAESFLFTFPLLMALIALLTHRPLALGFHNLCELWSVGTWDTTTSNQSDKVIDLIRSGLNGPVATSIAILFGTLVANTISNLIDRNANMHKLWICTSEDIRMARVAFNSFSDTDKRDANSKLDLFVERNYGDVFANRITVGAVRECTPYLEDCLRAIQNARIYNASNSNYSNAAYNEAYNAIARLRDHQGNLIATIQRRFPWFHYANLVTLALSICTIYLIETDPDVPEFIAEPQIALSWSLLIGTFSMLFVVVRDLSSPLTGIARVRYFIYEYDLFCLQGNHSVQCLLCLPSSFHQVLYMTEDYDVKQIEEYARRWDLPDRRS